MYLWNQLSLYAILWKIWTFMKLAGDYYDIYENEKKIISNVLNYIDV